ncbi:NAD(P)H-hydrate dehydratase [Candidatus Micrarchaeota archaeon]|nr:NAD(P)H-hydrate dehydratase [Candidatus Micrarchaeota archaeon]
MDEALSRRMRLLDANLPWFGYSVLDAMEKAGSGAAREIDKSLQRRGRKANIAIFTGPGNKGGDGLVAARHLAESGHEVHVFLAAEPKTMEARLNLLRLKKNKNVKIEKIDATHLPKQEFDAYVDALLGTGLKGQLRPPYDAIVTWLNTQTGAKVAIDVPTGFGSTLFFHDDLTISMHVSKKRGAKVVDLGLPKGLQHVVGPAHVKTLKLNQGQHKGQNGVLSIIGGSKKYHGAPLYAIEAAAPFVDLIYFHSPEKDNHWIARQMKTKSKAFITVEDKSELQTAVAESDAVLMGNGLEENAANKGLVNRLLRQFPNKAFVLDAGAMIMADSKHFGGRVLLTPHASEFKRRFGLAATAENVRKMAAKTNCIILLKGVIDVITDGKDVVRNVTGNPGMTRGGTGDVLAGLVAALSTQNNLFQSAQAGAFLNGLAGDWVAKKRRAFTADDVAKALPDALETAWRA